MLVTAGWLGVIAGSFVTDGWRTIDHAWQGRRAVSPSLQGFLIGAFDRQDARDRVSELTAVSVRLVCGDGSAGCRRARSGIPVYAVTVGTLGLISGPAATSSALAWGEDGRRRPTTPDEHG